MPSLSDSGAMTNIPVRQTKEFPVAHLAKHFLLNFLIICLYEQTRLEILGKYAGNTGEICWKYWVNILENWKKNQLKKWEKINWKNQLENINWKISIGKISTGKYKLENINWKILTGTYELEKINWLKNINWKNINWKISTGKYQLENINWNISTGKN